MSGLREDIIKRGLYLAHGSQFCGVKLTDMTREELLAVAAIMGDKHGMISKNLIYGYYGGNESKDDNHLAHDRDMGMAGPYLGGNG